MRYMLSSKKYIVIILIFIILIGGISVFSLIGSSTYEKNYFSKIGITGELHYEDIVAKVGVPINTIIISETESYIWTESKYDGFVISFCKEVNGSNRLMNIRITDPNYRLGKNKIGVGSSRLDVENAYSKQEKILDIEGLGYIDDLVWVEFYFDVNSEVDQIRVYYGP